MTVVNLILKPGSTLVLLKPVGYLAPSLFKHYIATAKAGGARYNGRCQATTTAKLKPLFEALEKGGFSINVGPELKKRMLMLSDLKDPSYLEMAQKTADTEEEFSSTSTYNSTEPCPF